MAKTIIIHNVQYNTQKAAIDGTRKFLLSIESIGEIYPTSQAWDYLNALVRRHPEYESKCGVGIAAFVICRNLSGYIALNIKCIDDTRVDISWRICVTTQPNTPLKNLFSAMRLAIQPQIRRYRNEQITTNCDICGKTIESSDDIHIDHEIPFKSLADRFLKENPDPPQTFDDNRRTNQATFRQKDCAFSQRWQAYHLKYARLRATHSKCNLSRIRG